MEEKSEARVQQESVMWFRNTYCLKHHNPRCIIASIPNETKDVVEQMKRKAVGLMAGFSDTILILPEKVIFCEFKTKGGRQGPKQIEFQQMVEALGYTYWLCWTTEEFQELVENELK